MRSRISLNAQMPTGPFTPLRQRVPLSIHILNGEPGVFASGPNTLERQLRRRRSRGQPLVAARQHRTQVHDVIRRLGLVIEGVTGEDDDL